MLIDTEFKKWLEKYEIRTTYDNTHLVFNLEDLKKYCPYVDKYYTQYIVHIDNEDWCTHILFETIMLWCIMMEKPIGASFFDLAYRGLMHSVEW